MIFKRVKKISVQMVRLVKSLVFVVLSFFKKEMLKFKELLFQKTLKLGRQSNKNKILVFGKIGLFLVFVGVMMNIDIIYNVNNYTKSSIKEGNANELVYMKISLTSTARANFTDFRNRMIAANKAHISNIEKQADEIEVWNPFVWAIKKLLLGVLTVIHLLVLASAAIFDQVITQDLFNDIIKDNESVYISWVMVRDFLNLFFMLALLLSAFSTIFQVEKYHLKKIIILLVVMALLVNFSYPITLFVIDFSNSVMYFFINLIPHSSATVSQSALVSKMTDMGMLTKSLMEKADITALILSIIFQFILFVTLFAFAINLLIRILAFAVLLIFSPVGFTLSFFPATSNIADSWWSGLIKYAVMGPLMIFFLLIANLMFNATGQQVLSMPEDVKNSVGFISSSLLFTLPIVFLWMGLIASQKFGGMASGSAMAIAKKTGNWVGKNGSRLAYRGVDTVSGHRISGGIGAAKQRWDRWGENYESKSAARSARYAQTLGVTGAEEQNMIRQSNEYKKKGLSESALKNMASSGDASAAYLLAENKKIDEKTYNEFTSKNKNENVKKAIDNKVKQTRVDLVAINKANDNKEIDKVITAKGWSVTSATDRSKARNYIIEQEFAVLDAEKYAQQDWTKIAENVNNLNTTGRTEEALMLEGAVADAFTSMTTKAQDNIKTKLSGAKAAELRTKFGVNVV